MGSILSFWIKYFHLGGRWYQNEQRLRNLRDQGKMIGIKMKINIRKELYHISFLEEVTTGKSSKIKKFNPFFLHSFFNCWENNISSPAKSLSEKPPISSKISFRQKIKLPAANLKVLEIHDQKQGTNVPKINWFWFDAI